MASPLLPSSPNASFSYDDSVVTEDKDTGVTTTVRTVNLNGRDVRVVTKKKVKVDPPAVVAKAEEQQATPTKKRSKKNDEEPVRAKEPPKPVDTRAIDIKDAANGPVATRQYEDRAQTLNRLEKDVKDRVAALAARVDPDRACDQGAIDKQLGTFFQSRREQGVADVEDKQIHNFANLKAAIERVRALGARVEGTDFKPIVAALEKGAVEALAKLEGSSARETEDEMVRVVDLLLANIEAIRTLEVPIPEPAHSDAQATDKQCAEFEVRRNADDWSPELISTEDTLYKRVDDVLHAAEDASEVSRKALGIAQGARATDIAHKLSVSDLASAKTGLEGLRQSLHQRERTEQETHGVLEKRLRDALAASNKAASAQADVVARLVDQIAGLTSQLNTAQLALWREEKNGHVIEVAIDMLNKKLADEIADAELQLKRAADRIRDLDASNGVAKVADDMLRAINGPTEAVRSVKEEAIKVNVCNIYLDRLALISRKYMKTSLAMFAHDARATMKKQQKIGVETKKKRSNAAQDTDGVAECNRSITELDRKIAEEVDSKEQLFKDLENMAKEWRKLYDEINGFRLTGELAGKVSRATDDWRNLVSQLQRIEEEQSQKLTLGDVLDASFLNTHLVTQGA